VPLGASAQDPFGAPPPAAAPAAAAADAQPKSAQPAATPAQPDPLPIRLLRDSNPTTPLDLLRAAELTLEFARPDETKRYLAKLLAATPTDETLAPLAGRFPDLLFRLAQQKDIQPEGKQAADLIRAAAQRIALDPQRMNSLIDRLSSPKLTDRQDALSQLAGAGPQVVPPMLRALADPARANEHHYLQAALVRLAGITELPLIAALETANDDLKAKIIAVLGHMKSTRATVTLVRPAVDPKASPIIRQAAAEALVRINGAAPDSYEAERYLVDQAARLLRGELPYHVDQDDLVELWSWDDANWQLVSTKLRKSDAAVLLAARAADDLYRLKPGDNAARRLMLLLRLGLAKSIAGLDKPLPMEAGTAGAFALQAGPQVTSQVLADALKHGRIAAALAAIEVLAAAGDASAVHTQSAAPSPLAEALVHSDRRVRLAAALAAVKLAPGGTFAGAGRISETLGWFAAAGGASSVLVGHPRGEDAQSLVGFMNALGYEGEAAYTGKALASRAFANPDFDFILISDAIDQPPVQELVQWLRRDFRTARAPIGVMARGERLTELREAFAGDPFTIVFPRLHSLETAAAEVAKLKAIAGRNYVGRDERITQAQAALAALATLAKEDETIAAYDLMRQEPVLIQALYNPALSERAAAVLALLGTPKSQTALVDFASQTTRPLADRQAAAAALAAAVNTRGLLLTQRQIAAQFDLGKTSQSLDQPSQELHAAILSTIQAPAIARGELKGDE
jgi:hypothetical protein